MAMSTELLKRLNSDEEPLPKRLRLAENAFRVASLPVLRKEEVILEWLCKTCPSDASVWSSLKHCLNGYFDIKRDVKKLLIDSLIRSLKKDEEVYEDVLECCRLLVANNGMQQYFVQEPKDLGLLIKPLLKRIQGLFKSTAKDGEQSGGIDVTLINGSTGITLTAYNVAISVVESVVQIYKSSLSSKHNLSSVFIHHILYPLCGIIDHKCVDSTNRLGAVAHKCVQLLVFGKKYAHSKAPPSEEDVAGFSDLWSVLKANAEKAELENNVMTFVFVFRAAIGVYKSDAETLDVIFRELVESAGTHKKQILNHFCKYLDYVTLDFDHKVKDVTLTEYCHSIIRDVLSGDVMTRTDYELLTQFSYLNPLMIEAKSQDILRKMFMQERSIEYTNLIIAILDANIRLRREEKLISQILIALRQTLGEIDGTKVDEFFPTEFKDKFVKSVNNITNSQGVSILRTLIFHLNTDCVQVLQSNDSCKNILIMRATVELLVSLLEGVCIFEYTGTLTSHQKFVNALDNLGSVLSLLVEKALHLNHNKKIIVILLSAISSWSEAQDALKYYVPKAVTQELTFPISEDRWQQLIQRITNFGEDSCKNSMNKLILYKHRTSQNVSDQSLKLNNLIGGIKYSWYSILRSNAEIIAFLSDKEIAKIANLLLTEMESSKDSFSQWVKILQRDCLQENKSFVVSLLCCVLTRVGSLLENGVAASVIKHLDTKYLVKAEKVGSKKVGTIMETIKDELAQNQWTQVDNSILAKIKLLLEVLLQLPLMFLSSKIRELVFMIVYAIYKECDQSEEVKSLCNKIFTDLLETSNIDIFKYIDPFALIEQLPKTKSFQNTVEKYFRSGVSEETFKSLTKSCTSCPRTMYFLQECMENVKSKLNADQKAELNRAQKKLNKIMLKNLPEKITENSDVKALTLILKVNAVWQKEDPKLQEIAESTLRNIFVADSTLDNEIKNDLLQEGLQLAVVVLRSYKTFDVSNETINGMWLAMLKCLCKDLLAPLLESSKPKEFQELLDLLHEQMVQSLSDTENNGMESICTIWNAIFKMDMAAQRSNIRLSAINKMLQTMQVVRIKEKSWPDVLKLLQNILEAKHLHCRGNIIDLIIVLGLKSVEEAGISTCSSALMICGTLIKVRTSLITDRLPALLLLYRSILNIIVNTSKTVKDESKEDTLRCLAIDIKKFTMNLVTLKKDMARLSPYLISDLLKLFSEASIAAFVKTSIQDCIAQLMTICDQHGIALLSRTLPVSMQEIFKTQLDTYNKFYKFSGKI